jgi:hypothetical protein
MRIKSIWLAVATAAAMGMSAGVASAAPGAPKGVVQRIKDPGTGLEIRVQQDRAGEVAIELGDRDVTVRRQLTHDHLQTVVTSGAEKIDLTIDKNGLLVSAGGRRIRVSASHPETGADVVRLLKSSQALRRATTLLGRVQLGMSSPVAHTLVLTRAFLLSTAGRASEAVDVVRTARVSLQQVRLTPARFGPGECWDEYAREAIAAYMEYEDCMKNSAWYDVFGMTSCAAIYDLRAVGAFSWWVSCVGLRGSDAL